MPKTYRITSETVNFSLVMPDDTTSEEAVAEASQTAKQILVCQAHFIRNGWQASSMEQVHDEEDEDAPTMLGKLCADYYRNV